jgi:hypothetical protein
MALTSIIITWSQNLLIVVVATIKSGMYNVDTKKWSWWHRVDVKKWSQCQSFHFVVYCSGNKKLLVTLKLFF